MLRIDRNRGLDPDTEFEQIHRNLVTYEFPWDMGQALGLALFRGYAVPSIGELLDATGEFPERAQKRHDDTGILLEIPIVSGIASADGRSAIRRINQMHRRYDIANADLLYILSNFVVCPRRWIEAYGWRRLTAAEELACVRYYQHLARHMAISDIPETYAEFERYMDDYEQVHFAYTAGGRRVADSTLALLKSFYLKPLAPLLDLFMRSVLDPPLLRALGYREPGPAARRVAEVSLRLRARVVALLPSRRSPELLQNSPRIRSYPQGFAIDELGTFVPGCPVRHASEPRSA